MQDQIKLLKREMNERDLNSRKNTEADVNLNSLEEIEVIKKSFEKFMLVLLEK